MQFRFRTLGILLLATALTGCANMASHDEKVNAVHAAGRSGGITAAIAQLDSSVKTEADKAGLLYNLERGELLRMNRQYDESIAAFNVADSSIKEWEESAKLHPEKLLGTAGAALVSERLKSYEGQDYEKVWLTTRLALNRVAKGEFDNARVEIKRTHEREAVIAEFRAKETNAAEEEAKAKGATVQGKEVNGYPVETLNDPEVLALKNGYQNALSHYLAGYLYEALNESGLAAPGYRKAIELMPQAAILEEGLRGLDERSSIISKRRQKMTDVLFVIEAGEAPARKPKGFTIPVPTGRGMQTVSISYPVISPSTDPLLTTLNASETTLKLEKVVDVNVMARRALKDEMPGMVTRSITRAVAKAVVQDQLAKHGGLLGSLVGSIGAMATESADDRMWRTLPGRVYLARGYLAPGEHTVKINERMTNVKINVDGQYALIPLRLYGDQILNGAVGSFGTLPEITAKAEPEVVVQEAADSNLLPIKAKPQPKASPKTVVKKTAASGVPTKTLQTK